MILNESSVLSEVDLGQQKHGVLVRCQLKAPAHVKGEAFLEF